MRQKIVLILVVILFCYASYQRSDWFFDRSDPELSAGVDKIGKAFKNKTSDLQVEGSGIVTAILPDDTYGTRHQRFILRLREGQTVLIAHNIDLSPRIDNLKKGDTVEFSGEYEWNKKGGVIHWTHHDPAGRHIDGWLKHNGRVFR